MADDDLHTTLRWPGASRLRAASSPAAAAPDQSVDEHDVLGRLHAIEGVVESLRGQLVREMTEVRATLQSLLASDARTLAGFGPLVEEVARVQQDAAHTRDEVGAIAASVQEIAEEIRAMPAVADSSVIADLAEEVAALRSEVTQLKRRISVRAQPEEA